MQFKIRRHFIALAAVALVASATSRVLGQAPRSVANALPPTTLAHVEITAEPCSRLSGQLALARVLAEPEVAAFLRPLMQFMGQQEAQLDQRLLAMSGLNIAGVTELLKGKLSFSLVSIKQLTGRRSGTDGDFLLTLDFSHAPELGAKLVSSLERFVTRQMKQTIEEHRVQGQSVRLIRLPNINSETVAWAVDKNVLHIANYASTLTQYLALRSAPDANAQTLGNSNGFLRAESECRAPSSIAFAYVNAKELLSVAARAAPLQFGFILKASGIDALKDIAYSASLDGSAIRDRIWMGVTGERGLLKALLPNNGSISSDQVVPTDTTFYSAGAFSLGSLWDQGKKLGDDEDANGLGELLAEFEEDIEAESGVVIGRDVFAHLGNEVACFVAMSQRSLIPDLGILLEVKDGAKLVGSITKLMGMADLEPRAFEFAGHRYHCIDLSDELSLSGLRPKVQLNVTWTVHKNWLLISPWPQSAKRLVARMEQQTGSISTQADYRQLMDQLSNEQNSKSIQGRTYLDLARIAGFVLDNGTPLLQAFMPQIPDLPIELDWAAIPLTETITQHLFGVAGVASQKEGGYLVEYSSPFGIIPAYAALVLGVAVPYATAGQEAMSVEVMNSVAEATLGIEAKRNQARRDLETLRTAVAMFSLRENRLPMDSEWPYFLLRGSARHPERYIDLRSFRSAGIVDPWGNPYLYRKVGSRFFEIRSLGRDGAPGGQGADADIKVGKRR